MATMTWAEQPDIHFQRSYLRTDTGLGCVLGVVVLMIFWIMATDGLAPLRAALCAAVAVGATSSLCAGNTFRLRDVRKRKAYALRALQEDDPLRVEAWSQLVPPSTISTRFTLSIVGSAIGVGTFIGNLVYAAPSNDPGLAFTSCLLGIVCCTLCAYIGTLIRPFD